jgi:hypothetical protein
LSRAVSNPATYYPGLSASQCESDNCGRTIAESASYKDHKALAIPIQGMGYGVADGRDSLPMAHLAVLCDCNHVVDQPARLCEAQVADGYDVRSLVAEAEHSHAVELARLRAPTQQYYGREQFGGSSTSAWGLKTQKLRDMTPQQLEGITTVATQELALLLTGPQPPIVVDVWAGSNGAIPSALTLYGGGFAYEDAAVEAAYEARFSGLLT